MSVAADRASSESQAHLKVIDQELVSEGSLFVSVIVSFATGVCTSAAARGVSPPTHLDLPSGKMIEKPESDPWREGGRKISLTHGTWLSTVVMSEYGLLMGLAARTLADQTSSVRLV